MNPVDLKQISEELRRVGLRQWLLSELTKAFIDARKGKLKTFDEHHFEQNWIKNIVSLRDSILERRYMPSPSVSFVIFKPMVREIFAAPFRDRVIHHFLYRMQAGWWDRRFLYDAYSCREEKGTLFGIRRAQRFMRVASDNCTKEAFVLKLDIRGYFMSLPRKKLYARVKWGLERQFREYMNDPMVFQLYKICRYLWKMILFDDPVQKARKRGCIDNWQPSILPPQKSLFSQPPGRGIVIGNLTSQLVSNIYLDQLDRFVFHTLGYKYYGRYVDDFFIMTPENGRERLLASVPLISDFLRDQLELTLHPTKRYFQSIYKGMSFLGARVYPHCLFPSDRLQSNFRQAANDLSLGYINVDSIVSYLGIMTHLNAEKFARAVFDEMGWRYDPDNE